MDIKSLLKGLDYEVLKGDISNTVEDIQYNSRKVKEGDIFFCIKGFQTDGHIYAKDAILKGATAIIVERDLEIKENGELTIIKVEDSRKALAIAASNYYENPSSKLNIIGVTGTNGKTTTTYMIKSILESAGYKVGVIGTIANYIGNTKLDAERTTPESLELHKLFKDMLSQGVQYCIMEVSSHSLSLDRVYGVKFKSAIFTNLTQDHLDFHKTFENYYNAKLILFKNTEFAAINLDDKYGVSILEDIKDIEVERATYSIEKDGDYKAQDINTYSKGLDFSIIYNKNISNITVSLPGKYNVYNALGAITCCLHEGIHIKYIQEGLKNVSVPGRCEIVTKDMTMGYDIILDYAHTPDGLENILKTARDFTKGRLISIYGCGGDRDKTKRPIMGRIGTELSDIAIVTSDNPRTEDPTSIIEDILKGIEKENYIVIENRAEAIEKAIKIARTGDVIVIAGKGHETYQILKDKTIHFDEREIVKEVLLNIN